MEDTIVLYSSLAHLNSMLILCKFFNKHHPTLPVTILSSTPALESATTVISSLPSVTYHRLPPAVAPHNLNKNPVELLFEIPRLNNPNLRQALLQISEKSRIRAIVIDFFCNAAFDVSTDLGIPTYFYVSSGAFFLCVLFHFPTIDEKIGQQDLGSLNDFVEVPGCPPIYSSYFPPDMLFRRSPTYQHFLSTANNMRRSAGIVVNSFDALESRAKEALVSGACVPGGGPTPPAYLVGPLVVKAAAGGGGSGSDRHECLQWLDAQPCQSVVFLCFGRRGLFSAEQLKEMAVGLENSGHRFLWSVRSPVGVSEVPDLEALLPDGFLERTKGRGFVIKSWAPQTEVLDHKAVAGFVTHCGSSSMLEALIRGVPMITWPIDAEQRMNKVFMVEEMGVGLPLEGWDNGFVAAAELEKRVKELMDTKAVRERVGEMRRAAEAAVGEGGSSVSDLNRFVATVTRD
ncbi:UDP-glycosyltransferase 88A1 [Striga hermonthica]|uniref:Glycosyltransferase n=1 Tax=Striga hermonthica TaxID=68872 RepID=A0A9N7MQL0_STRHE|nr:UDP-glycosyltransferase 88A1 [Striga hermonthica]